MRSGKKEGNEEIKRHRYVFQTRSQIDALDDGYRWRKYGKKTVKSNKFPRSYYRCAYHGCNVKKQIQRHSKDEHVVITTYEGMHIHPVPKPDESFQHILENMQIYNQPSNISPSLQGKNGTVTTNCGESETGSQPCLQNLNAMDGLHSNCINFQAVKDNY